MKVIVDNKIPYIKEAIEKIADEVIFLPGNEFDAQNIKDADALIIRTRTHCNRELLEGSSVKFIATATIGYDHIDTKYCREAGITWTNAPGCNSSSVAQYLYSALLLLCQKKGCSPKDLCIGIVGVGNVGSKVQKVAASLGMKVLLNDPPRADKEDVQSFTDLETIIRECNVITFHTPLNRDGEYKTYHLADDQFFQSLQRSPVIINTSRGEVIDTAALLFALETGKVSDAVIDVWEYEPDISPELLNKAFIGTPHIAGYSADGKANATRMSLESLCRFFGIDKEINIVPPAPETSVITASSQEEAILKIYDPRVDSEALKAHPELFEHFRGNYPLRREENAFTIILKG